MIEILQAFKCPICSKESSYRYVAKGGRRRAAFTEFALGRNRGCGACGWQPGSGLARSHQQEGWWQVIQILCAACKKYCPLDIDKGEVELMYAGVLWAWVPTNLECQSCANAVL